MISSSMILNIDNLRKNYIVEPYYHGLGMIRLIMRDRTLNFHGKLIPPEAHYIHNHKRNFISTCLFGEVKNIYYRYEISDTETEYVLEEIDCIAGEKQRLLHKDVNLIYEGEVIQKPGDVIHHCWKDIHDFECLSDYALTNIKYVANVSDVAYIIRHKNEKYLCALSNKGDIEKSWDIIEEILNSNSETLLLP